MFWVVALYVGAAGFYSITKQVFWPERASAFDAGCVEGVRQLEGELLEWASAAVAAGGTTYDRRAAARWLRDWDARHTTLADRCEGRAARAHTKLAILRARTEAFVERFEREQASLVRDIDRDTRGASPD